MNRSLIGLVVSMVKKSQYIIYLIFFLFTCHASVAETAQSWLQHMATAFTRLNYQGTMIYSNASGIETLKVYHSYHQGVEKERLIHLDGPHRELIRNGNKVTCLLPHDFKGDHEHALRNDFFSKNVQGDFDQLEKFYDIRLGGSGRVASQKAQIIEVNPKDDLRFGYRLWLDQETKLLLKSEQLNEFNRPVEVFQFTEITYDNELNDSLFELPEKTTLKAYSSIVESDKKLINSANSNASASNDKWSSIWVPSGFTKTDSSPDGSTQDISNSTTYSDGLSAFTVFVEDDIQNDSLNSLKSGVTQMGGATIAVVREVAGPSNSRHLVTVVGEVPKKTAMKVAKSLNVLPTSLSSEPVMPAQDENSSVNLPSTSGKQF